MASPEPEGRDEERIVVMASRALGNVLVTGGAGFVGSNFVRHLFEQDDFRGRVVNLDALTYAGNLGNLADLDVGDRHVFERVDVRDEEGVRRVFATHDVDAVVHLAAETHVDRSIVGPEDFVTTNVVGTFRLLEAARSAWKGRDDVLFHHVSTDEVYGSLGETGKFVETTPYDPRSPYSASKASSDHLVRAYGHTYGLPVTLSHCSNNYGPYQFPEKLVPLTILHLLEGKPVPVYGDGGHVRDWLYVRDHASALWAILRRGRAGERWNVGGDEERRNVDLVRTLCEIVARRTGRDPAALRGLVRHVKDRPGHDRRYAIDSEKIRRDLGWRRSVDLESGLDATVAWYLSHGDWVDAVRSGSYRDWLETNYGRRS
jgi:dTDP-glucose 4,6-dehydratase